MTGPEITSEGLASLSLVRGASPELEWVELDGECIVWSDPTQELHRLDRIATLIFHLCDGTATLAQTIDELSTRFGVERDAIEADVVTCARLLLDAGLVSVRTR